MAQVVGEAGAGRSEGGRRNGRVGEGKVKGNIRGIWQRQSSIPVWKKVQ